MDHIKFKHPFTMLVGGPTSSGKTAFVREILNCFNHIISRFKENQLKVLWCYGVKQELLKVPFTNKNISIEYIAGPPKKALLEQLKPNLLVIDDQMNTLGNSEWLLDFFTQHSHHWGISVIFIVQNVFHKSTKMREISLNSQYIVLMKNPRDKQQVVYLGRQLFPGKNNFFMESYTDATNDPYGYLVIDNTIDTPEHL